jgi:hypothetical protein
MRRTLIRNPKLEILMEFAPPHLQRAGVKAGKFLNSIRAAGLHVRRVDDATGELLMASDEELVSSHSTNLYLSRDPAARELKKGGRCDAGR